MNSCRVFCFSLLLFLTSCLSKRTLIKDTPSEEAKAPVKTATLELPEKHKLELSPSLGWKPKKVYPQKSQIKKYCKKIDAKFKKFYWGKSYCESFKWNHVRNSILGHPLIWAVYGSEAEHREEPKDVTLLLCGVHGDEVTPIKFCFDALKHLEVNGEHYKDKLIVVAPIVNPDSIFKKRMTRTNHRGVDINRNFPTKDWNAKALKLWRNRYRKDPRRYPGKRPNSEPETIFQVNLIKRYSANKIISVHAPLTMLDYDGPSDEHDHNDLAGQLLVSMSEKAAGYRVKNYPYFPGSLGNYAGNERGIPTYTLELPTSDARYTADYWKLFREAMHYAFLKDLRPRSIARKEEVSQ